MKWFRRAVEPNKGLAQETLANPYADGIGVVPDIVEVHAWLTLAAKSFSAAHRDHVEKAMSPAQVAAGKKRAEELRALMTANLKNVAK